LKLIRNSQLFLDMQPVSDDVNEINAYYQYCMQDLTTRTRLNMEQLREMVLGLDISMILTDNTILNILGAYGFKNYDALCLAYVRHVEERLGGVFANVEELGDYVKNTIRKYTCIDGVLLEDQFDCQNCLDAVSNEHIWCLKRMKDDICDPKWCGILDYALLKDNLEIVKCVYENGARLGLATEDWMPFRKMHIVKQRLFELLQTLTVIGITDYSSIVDAGKDICFIRSLDVMKYAIEQNFLVPETATSVAVFGNLELVKFLHEAGYPWSGWWKYVNVLSLSILSGNIDLAKYVVENGCDEADSDIEFALWSDNIEMLRYVISIKSRLKTIPRNGIFLHMSRSKNLPMIKMVCEYHRFIDSPKIDYAWPYDLFDYAIRVGCIELINLMIKSELKPEKRHIEFAIVHGEAEILKLFLENGCEIESGYMVSALVHGSFDCFKVLHEFNCPKSFTLEGDIDKWIVSEHYNEEFHKYLITNGYVN
jgi:hypothetical protein